MDVFHQFQTNNGQWKVLGIDVLIGYVAGIMYHTHLCAVTTCPLLLIK